ncbi:MAG: hypothetical protein Q9166_001030 [cf. Caloplaca sp. 2 TL-2023]
MTTKDVLLTSDLSASLPLLSKGKGRDIHEVDESTLLIVTTDRVSAFDVVLDSAIPNKGASLTLMTAHWAKVLCEHYPGLRIHFLTLELPPQIPSALHDIYRHRSMQVRKLQPFKMEAIVHGHLTCEAWDSYQKDRTVCRIKMPEGLKKNQRFPDGPIYTPSTKAEVGEHDEDISEEQAAEIDQRTVASSLQQYNTAHAYALERSVIIADTKFEFGLDTETDKVVLMDEILTPDSSRFWKKETYRVGEDPAFMDKQYLRDWLMENGLNGKEGVELPEEVKWKTKALYRQAFRRLVGKTLDEATRE